MRKGSGAAHRARLENGQFPFFIANLILSLISAFDVPARADFFLNYVCGCGSSSSCDDGDVSITETKKYGRMREGPNPP
jgi:hypothetical protein